MPLALRRHPEPAGAAGPPGPLAPWEETVLDAVGRVIEFWGFKRNQGRMWALLYLRGEAMSAAELQEVLGLSKGAVSMLTRALERWQVLRRVRRPGDPAARFEANTQLLSMIAVVLQAREGAFLSEVHAQLVAAETAARNAAGARSPVADRVARMRRLAERVEQAVRVFARTARLDFRGVFDVLQVRPGRGTGRSGGAP